MHEPLKNVAILEENETVFRIQYRSNNRRRFAQDLCVSISRLYNNVTTIINCKDPHRFGDHSSRDIH